MTEREIDALVAQIGDELLGRLNGSAPAGLEAEPAPLAGWRPPSRGLNTILDLTLLNPVSTAADIRHGCATAKQASLRAVCTASSRVAVAERALRGSQVVLAAAVGFPHGAAATPAKLAEAELALRNGAQEIETVASPAALREGDLDRLHAELRAMAELVQAHGARLTVTLEAALLDDQQLLRGGAVARLAGADAVKTATGFNAHGPVAPRQVAALAAAIGADLAIVAGDTRSFGGLTHLVAAGAVRAASAQALEVLASSGV
jgi:deoxyribose-phosphate aldolase